MRFECQAPVGMRKNKDRTFSLLPAQLVPYQHLCISAILKIAQFYLSGNSVREVCDEASGLGEKEPLCLNPAQIKRSLVIIQQAFNRLPLVPEFKAAFKTFLRLDAHFERLRAFIHWAQNYLKGVAALAVKFWSLSGCFLF